LMESEGVWTVWRPLVTPELHNFSPGSISRLSHHPHPLTPYLDRLELVGNGVETMGDQVALWDTLLEQMKDHPHPFPSLVHLTHKVCSNGVVVIGVVRDRRDKENVETHAVPNTRVINLTTKA